MVNFNAAAVPPMVWEKWNKAKDTFDQWRRWPADPFVSRNSNSDTPPDMNQIAEKTSVFQAMIEQVLAPYFDFKSVSGFKRTATQKSAIVSNMVSYRKLVFLYGLTLFRHSRHVNALCSEGVFQCPNRSNAHAVDNDFLRSEEIVRWIEELRQQRIFLDKPGGSFWMHRDVRLTLQHFFEHLNLHKGKPADVSANRFLQETRSRIHFWIGDWYQKAFNSSGHLTPIIESLHHRIMAALLFAIRTFQEP